MKNKITNVTNKLALTISLLSLGICPAQEFEFTDLFPQKEGVSCYRIPSIVTAPNGDLISAIDERIPSCADLRDNNNINIVAGEVVTTAKAGLPSKDLWTIRWDSRPPIPL